MAALCLLKPALLGSLALGPCVSTDIESLVDQPVDYISHMQSDNWRGAVIQVADDFIPPPGHAARITKVSFTMAVSWPNVPRRFSLEVFRTIENDNWPWNWSPRCPPAEFIIHTATRVIDRGEWTGGGHNQGFTLHEVEVVFDNLDIVLEPGVSLDNRWFFSPVGHITHPSEQISYWATAGEGRADGLNWSDGWLLIAPIGCRGWRLVRYAGDWETTYPPPDFAMTLEGELFPAPEPAELADFEIVRGEHLRGDLDDLTESDDQYLAVSSGGGERFGEFQCTEIIITAHTEVANVTRMDLAVEARRAGEGEGVMHLALRNWRSGEFEEIGSFPVGFEDESFEMTGIDAAQYVSETGEIDLDLRHETLLPFLAFGFDTWLDYVHIIVAMEE